MDSNSFKTPDKSRQKRYNLMKQSTNSTEKKYEQQENSSRILIPSTINKEINKWYKLVPKMSSKQENSAAKSSLSIRKPQFSVYSDYSEVSQRNSQIREGRASRQLYFKFSFLN